MFLHKGKTDAEKFVDEFILNNFNNLDSEFDKMAEVSPKTDFKSIAKNLFINKSSIQCTANKLNYDYSTIKYAKKIIIHCIYSRFKD